MNTIRNALRSPWGIAALIGLLMLAACAGVAARDEGGTRAALAVFDAPDIGIATDIEQACVIALREGRTNEQGAATIRESAKAFREALKTEARAAAVRLWTESVNGLPPLRMIAEDGIEARVQNGEIDAAVAGSWRERLSNFDQLIANLAERL